MFDHLESHSKDLLLVSHFTKSQKSIQILIDFNPTKFDLIRILSFAHSAEAVSLYKRSVQAAWGVNVVIISISIYGRCSEIVAPVDQFKN